MSAPVVSFDDEQLILVDSDDNVVGYDSKSACHDGDGVLHRAFSVFLFNDAGEVLLQQRSADKRLWGGYWANSCCSHPRRGETLEEATGRRVSEELGVSTQLHYLYTFEYQARFGDAGTEHELCSVWVGRCNELSANRNEIAATAFVSPEALDRELADRGDNYTPWLKLEWQRLRGDLWAEVERALDAAH